MILSKREKYEKMLDVQKFRGNTALWSVSFVGWWGLGGTLFFLHTSVQRCPYTRATGGKPRCAQNKFLSQYDTIDVPFQGLNLHRTKIIFWG